MKVRVMESPLGHYTDVYLYDANAALRSRIEQLEAALRKCDIVAERHNFGALRAIIAAALRDGGEK